MPSEKEIEEAIELFTMTEPFGFSEIRLYKAGKELSRAYLSMKSERDALIKQIKDYTTSAIIAESNEQKLISERDKYKEIVEEDTAALRDIKEKARIQRPDQMTTRYIDYRNLEDTIDSALSLRDKKEE